MYHVTSHIAKLTSLAMQSRRFLSTYLKFDNIPYEIWIVEIMRNNISFSLTKMSQLLRASLEKLILRRLLRWWSFQSKTHF